MKKVIYFIFHPFDIILFLEYTAMRRMAGETVSPIVYYVEHTYLKKTPGMKVLLKCFDEVHCLPYCDLSKKKFFKSLKQLFSFSRSLRQIDVTDVDAFYAVCKAELPTLLVYRYIKNKSKSIKTILFQQFSIHDMLLMKNAHARICGYKTDYIVNFVYVCLSLMFHVYIVRQVKQTRNNALLIRFVPNVHQIYDRVIVFKNPITELISNHDEMYYPFVDLPKSMVDNCYQKLSCSYKEFAKIMNSDKKIVLFLGGAFLSWEYISKEEFLERISALIIDLKNKHQDSLFVYLPHPRECNESQLLPLEHFVILNNVINAETFYVLFKSRIKIVYSIKSTAIKFALAFGIPSLLLYKKLPFKAEAYSHFESFLDCTFHEEHELYLKRELFDNDEHDRRVIQSYINLKNQGIV